MDVRAPYRVLREMLWLRELLDFSRVTIRFVFLSVDEYKRLDGYGADKKRKASRIERIPGELLDMVDLTSAADVAAVFLPDGLPSPFTSADFSRLTGARRRALSADLSVLEHLGLGPRDALKKDSRGLCRGAAGNPRVPRLLPGTLGKAGNPRVPRLLPGTLGNFPGCL